MVYPLLLGLALCLGVPPEGGQAPDGIAARTCEAYYTWNDAAATAAAREWIRQDGGALAWYYLGRIHMQQGRNSEARKAFKEGMNACTGLEARKVRVLKMRLKRLDRVAAILDSREEKSAALRTDFVQASERTGREMLEKGWTRAGVHHLALARLLNAPSGEAMQISRKFEVEEAVRLQVLLRSPGWRALVPATPDTWTRLDTGKLEEGLAAPTFVGEHLCLNAAPRGAALHETGIPGADRVWVEFKVSREEGVEGWQVGILHHYKHPRDIQAVTVDQDTVKVMRFVVEPGEGRGAWRPVSEKPHNLRPAPGAWHRLVVSIDTETGTASVYLDEHRAACVQVRKEGLGDRFGVMVVNAAVSFRKVRVGKQCEPR